MADYERGYEDGVEYVLSLIDNYINRVMLNWIDNDSLKALENLFDDVKETIDNT